MPRTPKDYSKMCFYRLVCRDITITQCYVGSTTNAVDRRYNHKSKCHNEKYKGYNLRVYRFIRDHGGFENWQLLVIEQLAMADEVATALRERHWTEHFKATLNKQVQGRTDAEYGAEYRAEHREKRNQQSAEWQAAHEVHLKTKHDCPCGGKHTTNGKSHHFKTALHVAYLAALPAV